MNKRLKITLLTLVSLFVSIATFANDTTKTAPKPNPYELEIYGFVRNDFTFDSRKTLASVGELFNFIPMDNSFNAAGDDLNAIPTGFSLQFWNLW